ncbi:hypothetical protein QFZ97_006581 [Paraburkholderia youngii]
MLHLRESCMPENGTCSLRGGRRPARQRASSDPTAMKPANKAGEPAAEWAEPRAGTKGNTGQPRTHRAQNRVSVPQGLARVRQAARQRKKERFTALLHHVTVDRLRMTFFALKRNAAPGVDGLTWRYYEAGLEENLQRLFAQVQNGAYRAHCLSGDSTYQSRTANSARWGLPRWKTRSSSGRWWKC